MKVFLLDVDGVMTDDFCLRNLRDHKIRAAHA